jgi:hypothetical protein
MKKAGKARKGETEGEGRKKDSSPHPDLPASQKDRKAVA